MKKRVLALMCASVMLLSGCGSNGTGVSELKTKPGTYPIAKEDLPSDGTKLTYWVAKNANMQQSNIGETKFAIGLEERTGVPVEYIQPTETATDLAGRIASNDLPDMIENGWKTYEGGGEVMIRDGVILELNDLIDKYAPNLKKYLSEHPEIDKMIKTDSGQYYCFPFIRSEDRLLISTGPMIRKDWLEKYNLEMPKTVADIENVLKTFKANGVKTPMSMMSHHISNQFMGNFNTSSSYYYKDGKVVYGPVTPEYKFGVETLAKWYKEGLIDNNYPSYKKESEIQTKIYNDEVGLTLASGGGGLGTMIQNYPGNTFEMVGFSYTAIDENTPNVQHMIESNYPGYGSVAISTSCKYPALAVAWLDYGYSEEGSEYFNWGVEGESFEIVDGKHQFTDLINNPPQEGWTKPNAMLDNLRSSTAGPFVQDVEYIDQFYADRRQQESLNNWVVGMEEAKKTTLPSYTLTEEEQKENTSITDEINTFVNAEITKFITGNRPMSEWDSFVQEIKDAGIDKVTANIEAACKRYEAR